MKTIVYLCAGILLFITSLTSCCCQKEKELQAQVDSLTNLIKQTGMESIIDARSSLSFCQPYPKVDSADFDIENFHKSTDLFIPTAWKISLADLSQLIKLKPDHIKLYPAVKKGKNVFYADSMTLAIVATDSNGNDILTENEGEVRVYDFAQRCPPNCSVEGSILLPKDTKMIKEHHFKRK